METIKIQILDPVHSLLVDKKHIPMLSKLLTYEAVGWRNTAIKDKNGIFIGKFKKERFTYPKSLLKPSGIFFTGFVPKIEEFLKGKNLPVQAMNSPQITVKNQRSPATPIQLYPHQEKLLQVACTKRRGVIKAGTGSGKTVLAASIISSFEDVRALFLCHTKTLVRQTISEFEKFNLKVGYITGEGTNLNGGVIVSTIQSFVKQPQELLNSFDMVIVDEVHRFANSKGQYFDVLSRMIAPYRYGLTATLNKNQEVALLTEGLIGPLIGEFTLKEGIETGILAKPKLKFITIPIDYKVRDLRRYQEVYDMGIVLNRARNRMIIKTAKDLAKAGKTSLILISKIEHGNSLVEMAELIGHPVVFIQGKDDSDIRENVRGALNRKEIKTVIATQIWKEGVDIKTLNAVINAAGGKSEIAVLQSLGRGLRTAEGKESILLVDILDLSHHYLTSHLAERLAIYSQEEWL